MFEKIKAGDMELIKPDGDCMKLMQQLVSQNETILDMNTQLIGALLTPVFTTVTLSGETIVPEPFPGSPAHHEAERKDKQSTS